MVARYARVASHCRTVSTAGCVAPIPRLTHLCSFRLQERLLKQAQFLSEFLASAQRTPGTSRQEILANLAELSLARTLTVQFVSCPGGER